MKEINTYINEKLSVGTTSKIQKKELKMDSYRLDDDAVNKLDNELKIMTDDIMDKIKERKIKFEGDPKKFNKKFCDYLYNELEDLFDIYDIDVVNEYKPEYSKWFDEDLEVKCKFYLENKGKRIFNTVIAQIWDGYSDHITDDMYYEREYNLNGVKLSMGLK